MVTTTEPPAVPLRGLYAITDSQLLADDRLLPFCAAALRGGAGLLQYRDKSNNAEKRLREASELRELCEKHNARLIINDDLTLAAQLSCDLHLGQEDGSLLEARQQLGDTAIIGATCHHRLELACQAVEDKASYVAFGRFYGSHTKPGEALADTGLLQQAQTLGCPIVAIGGITLENASPLIHAGAAMIAVIHALFAAPSAAEVERRASAFTQLFT